MLQGVLDGDSDIQELAMCVQGTWIYDLDWILVPDFAVITPLTVHTRRSKINRSTTVEANVLIVP